MEKAKNAVWQVLTTILKIGFDLKQVDYDVYRVSPTGTNQWISFAFFDNEGTEAQNLLVGAVATDSDKVLINAVSRIVEAKSEIISAFNRQRNQNNKTNEAK